jgi:tetratricopeptide (TPR) repeat protein
MATPPPPEMADDRKNQIAKDCFKRGTEAMIKQNWGYSCEMFRNAVNLVPGNLLFRQSLRGVQEKQYNNNGSGASMASMRLMGTKTSLQKSRLQKDWKSILQTAEDGLAINPWDAGINAELGHALKELGYPDIATFCYERAVKGDPNNKDYLRILGLLYEEKERYDDAIGCFMKITQIDKLDGEARSKVMALTSKKAIKTGGYENAPDSRSTGTAGRGKDVADGPGMSVEADLERAVRKEPNNKDSYLKLADYQIRDGKLEKAAVTLRKGLEVSGGDSKISEQLEDVELDLQRKELGLAKEEAIQDPTDAAAKRNYVELKADLLRKEIEIYTARIERYPQNMALKFELGLRLMQDKRPKEAIPLFQKSRGDARRKVESLVNLGKCFIADKQFTLARRQFETALPECKPDENLDVFLELNYFAGRVCEELKDKEAAIGFYQTVLEYDYEYKDNQQRLNELEGGGAQDDDDDEGDSRSKKPLR